MALLEKIEDPQELLIDKSGERQGDIMAFLVAILLLIDPPIGIALFILLALGNYR